MSNEGYGNFSAGTDFQKLVWRELVGIPLGETRTYKEIARSIGRPNSARAVANACSKNPFAPEVPCHRVIRSDGKIGGYSGPGGVPQKREILESEGVKLGESEIDDEYGERGH